jgi:hypothetical protein
MGCGVGWSRACPFTRRRAWPAVGPWLVGGVRLVCPAGRAEPAVRSPERALSASPGQRPGSQGPPPHSTLKGCSNRTSHTAPCRTPSGCWIGGAGFPRALPWAGMCCPFLGKGPATRSVRSRVNRHASARQPHSPQPTASASRSASADQPVLASTERFPPDGASPERALSASPGQRPGNQSTPSLTAP